MNVIAFEGKSFGRSMVKWQGVSAARLVWRYSVATCQKRSEKLENIFKQQPIFPSVMVERQNFRQMSGVGDEIRG